MRLLTIFSFVRWDRPPRLLRKSLKLLVGSARHPREAKSKEAFDRLVGQPRLRHQFDGVDLGQRPAGSAVLPLCMRASIRGDSG